MEQLLEEQTNKLQRYETKLRDIIIAYKKLQSENEALSHLVQSSEHQRSQLHQELDEKTKALNDQCVKVSDLSYRLETLVLEKNRYREEAEKIPSLTEQVEKLLRDLITEQTNSRKLKVALEEAQEQHEITTHHFETRISDIISTFKTYQEIHLNDTETINQLRSGKSQNKDKEFTSPQTLQLVLTDVLASFLERKTNDAEASQLDELFDCMLQIWRAIGESTQLHQSAIEKRLLQRLHLKFLVSIELLEACESERAQLQQELEYSRLCLQNIHDGTRKFSAPSQREYATSTDQIFDSGTNENASKRKLELQLQEAQDLVKLLRKQNLTALLELESARKSAHSKLMVLERETAERLAEATSQHETQLMHTEAEARRYREQTLSLLTEKEEEISELRTALLLSNHENSDATFLHRRPLFPSAIAASVSGGSCNGEVLDSTTITPCASITSRTDFDESSPSVNLPHCVHVHCAERHGRMALELKKLRAGKRELEQRIEQLETRLREGEKAAAFEAARSSTKTEDSSSPTAVGCGDVNLAYVKNIIFNLLSSFRTSSLASRLTVVKALAMALHFDPEEENALIAGIIG